MSQPDTGMPYLESPENKSVVGQLCSTHTVYLILEFSVVLYVSKTAEKYRRNQNEILKAKVHKYSFS